MLNRRACSTLEEKRDKLGKPLSPLLGTLRNTTEFWSIFLYLWPLQFELATGGCSTVYHLKRNGTCIAVSIY